MAYYNTINYRTPSSVYKEKEYDIITGTVLRKDKGTVFVNIG